MERGLTPPTHTSVSSSATIRKSFARPFRPLESLLVRDQFLLRSESAMYGLQIGAWLVLGFLGWRAETPKVADAEKQLSTEQIVEEKRKSIALVTVSGRSGGGHAIGTAFIVSPDGLLATNFHVIGE